MDNQMDDVITILQEISEKLSFIEGKLDDIDSNTTWLEQGLDNITTSIDMLDLN